jgi:hypothetical protein
MPACRENRVISGDLPGGGNRVVIWPVVISGSHSGLRWLMAFAVGDATEMRGSFDADC